MQGIFARASEVNRVLFEAEQELLALLTRNPNLTIEYFESQWARQKEMQTDVISETAKQKRDQIMLLLGVEEQLIEAM